MIKGIFSSVDGFKKRCGAIKYLAYGYDDGRRFVTYCWNIFSTIIFWKHIPK